MCVHCVSQMSAPKPVLSVAVPNLYVFPGGPYITASPNNKHVLTSCIEDECLRLYSIDTCAVVKEYKFPDYSRGVAYSSSGSFIACGTAYGSVRLINAESGSVMKLEGEHLGTVYSVAISSDEKTVVSSGSSVDKCVECL